MSNSLIFFHI